MKEMGGELRENGVRQRLLGRRLGVSQGEGKIQLSM